MNYIILNNKEFFQDKININGFKEVEVNGNNRVDAVFAEITKGILEPTDNIEGGRDSILQEEWLFRDRGVSIIVCKFNRNLLYNENEDLIEKLLELYSKDYFFIELWNINVEESHNQLESYVVCYNKNFGYTEILKQDDESDDSDIFKTILRKIEKNLL